MFSRGSRTTTALHGAFCVANAALEIFQAGLGPSAHKLRAGTFVWLVGRPKLQIHGAGVAAQGLETLCCQCRDVVHDQLCVLAVFCFKLFAHGLRYGTAHAATKHASERQRATKVVITFLEYFKIQLAFFDGVDGLLGCRPMSYLLLVMPRVRRLQCCLGDHAWLLVILVGPVPLALLHLVR